MSTDDIIEKLEPWLARHRRLAWKPVVKDGDGPASSSKFCGTPWIGPDAPWPHCGHCNNPLPLFLQLDLDELPKELGGRFGTGLLQLFYCTLDKCQGCGGWEPFADDLSRVRIVRPTDSASKGFVVEDAAGFPAKRIVGWSPLIDLPKPSEHEELGLKYTYDFDAGTVRLACPELGLLFDSIKDHMLAENIANSQLGDKLAGWPAWIQGVEYPKCPQCGRRMVHVFQVDSEDNIPFMFGDAGCGHITQCPVHKEVVAFGWACC
jgi:uncharacterized protein YwqG